MVGWERSFFERVQHESIPEAKVEIVLQRALEVHLWFGLAAKGKSLGVVVDHITRNLDRVNRLNLTIIEFFHYVHGRSIIERWVYERR